MKVKSQVLWGAVLSSGFLSACSNQHTAKSVVAPVVVSQPPILPMPAMAAPPASSVPTVITPSVMQSPKVVEMIPAPAPAVAPYRDIVVAPASLQPVLQPTFPPAPSIKPLSLPVATVLSPTPVTPKVKAKGVYRGTVPVDSTLLQQYQQ